MTLHVEGQNMFCLVEHYGARCTCPGFNGNPSINQPTQEKCEHQWANLEMPHIHHDYCTRCKKYRFLKDYYPKHQTCSCYRPSSVNGVPMDEAIEKQNKDNKDRNAALDSLQENDWEKELEQFLMEVQDGSLKGCLVYHEAVKEFISHLVTQTRQQARAEREEEIVGIIGNYEPLLPVKNSIEYNKGYQEAVYETLRNIKNFIQQKGE